MYHKTRTALLYVQAPGEVRRSINMGGMTVGPRGPPRAARVVRAALADALCRGH